MKESNESQKKSNNHSNKQKEINRQCLLLHNNNNNNDDKANVRTTTYTYYTGFIVPELMCIVFSSFTIASSLERSLAVIIQFMSPFVDSFYCFVVVPLFQWPIFRFSVFLPFCSVWLNKNWKALNCFGEIHFFSCNSVRFWFCFYSSFVCCEL